MKVISNEEIKHFKFKGNNGKYSRLREKVGSLSEGESLLVEKGDVGDSVTSVGTIVSYHAKRNLPGRKFTTRELQNGGWVVQRVV